MTACRLLLIVAALCSVPTLPALAQPDGAAALPPTVHGGGRAAPTVATTARADAVRTAAAPTRPTTRFTPPGSAVVLADGIVADARLSPLPPPAAGFQYER